MLMTSTMTSINIFTVKQVRERENLYNCPAIINNPGDIDKSVRAILGLDTEAAEKVGFLSLSAKNAILGVHIISLGTLITTCVHPREVFKAAFLNNAASIVLFHNHPSGDPTPSRDDVELTNRLVACGQILGIPVLDHVIIGEISYVSLRERGLMEQAAN